MKMLSMQATIKTHSHAEKSMKSMMQNLLAAILLLSCWRNPSFAQTHKNPAGEKSDTKLAQKLHAALKDFRGDAGVYVRHLPSGRSVAIRADELFPPASMIKVPIMLALFEKFNAGEWDYHSDLVYLDSLLYEGEDLLGSFKNGEKIAFSKVVMLMITTSDNTASLWCQSLAGKGMTINNWLEARGFHQTRVNSRTEGREEARKEFGWGQTTPREMAELLVMIRERRAVSPAASDEMYRALTRIYWNNEALSQIPPHVQAASKQGAVNRSRSEVVLVNAPSGDYVFCLITKNQQDESWEYNNEGYALTRKVSRLLWQHFDPKSQWEPAEGFEKW